MATSLWVAFLRGMNLGGRRLTNDELVAAVTTCGCSDVTAYQASGNVVFQDTRGPDELRPALEEGLERELGYPVPVFLRSGEEVAEIAGATPFSDDELAASRGKPQVIILHDRLAPEAATEARSLAPDGDVLVPSERELHWLPAAGLSDNDLDLSRLDQVTGGTTVRTHGTLQRLAAKYL